MVLSICTRALHIELRIRGTIQSSWRPGDTPMTKNRPCFRLVVKTKAKKYPNMGLAKQGDRQSGMEKEILRGVHGGINHL